MDELLKEALGNVLENTQMTDSEKIELIKAIHTMYKWIDILEMEE